MRSARAHPQKCLWEKSNQRGFVLPAGQKEKRTLGGREQNKAFTQEGHYTKAPYLQPTQIKPVYRKNGVENATRIVDSRVKLSSTPSELRVNRQGETRKKTTLCMPMPRVPWIVGTAPLPPPAPNFRCPQVRRKDGTDQNSRGHELFRPNPRIM